MMYFSFNYEKLLARMLVLGSSYFDFRTKTFAVFMSLFPAQDDQSLLQVVMLMI